MFTRTNLIIGLLLHLQCNKNIYVCLYSIHAFKNVMSFGIAILNLLVVKLNINI